MIWLLTQNSRKWSDAYRISHINQRWKNLIYVLFIIKFSLGENIYLRLRESFRKMIILFQEKYVTWKVCVNNCTWWSPLELARAAEYTHTIQLIDFRRLIFLLSLFSSQSGLYGQCCYNIYYHTISPVNVYIGFSLKKPFRKLTIFIF